jgi:hypothetical protein
MVCEVVPATTTGLSVWIEWAKALGPALVSGLAVLVSILSFRLSRQVADWQAAVARAQLRQNVYDRRFAVYQSAKALLIACNPMACYRKTITWRSGAELQMQYFCSMPAS